MSKIRPYKRYSPEEKAKHVEAWQKSGMTLAAYAIKHGMSPISLRVWLYNERNRHRLEASGKLPKRVPSSQAHDGGMSLGFDGGMSVDGESSHPLEKLNNEKLILQAWKAGYDFGLNMGRNFPSES